MKSPAKHTQVSPRWELPGTVESFRTSTPNEVLMAYAQRLQSQHERPLSVLDIGGGAARNALPLAKLEMNVVCTDLSRPMLDAAKTCIAAEALPVSLHLVHAPMTPLPFLDNSFDLIVAHGIWNLARSGSEFHQAVEEAARVAKAGAGLFLFTFSRHTIGTADTPVAGETFVFTQFNGEPQCFLTEAEIINELASVGFVREGAQPLTEYNRPATPQVTTQGPPVLYEGTFVSQAK